LRDRALDAIVLSAIYDLFIILPPVQFSPLVKKKKKVHGLNVGAAEVGYECSGLLRHALGRGELLSGRYYSANGAPPEVQFSASAPAHLPVRWLQPNTWLNFNRSNTDNRGTVPVFVSLEGAREETSHRLTSSFTAEQVRCKPRASATQHARASIQLLNCVYASLCSLSQRENLALPFVDQHNCGSFDSSSLPLQYGLLCQRW